MVHTILDGTLPIDLKDEYRIGKNKVFMISHDIHLINYIKNVDL